MRTKSHFSHEVCTLRSDAQPSPQFPLAAGNVASPQREPGRLIYFQRELSGLTGVTR
nr:MAG TPA_asm: hypothetical protein [Caudoviricetes sp.]